MFKFVDSARTSKGNLMRGWGKCQVCYEPRGHVTPHPHMDTHTVQIKKQRPKQTKWPLLLNITIRSITDPSTHPPISHIFSLSRTLWLIIHPLLLTPRQTGQPAVRMEISTYRIGENSTSLKIKVSKGGCHIITIFGFPKSLLLNHFFLIVRNILII